MALQPSGALKLPLGFVLGALLVLALAPALVHSQISLKTYPGPQDSIPCSCRPMESSSPSATPPPSGLPPDPASYDEQMGMTFTQSFTSMAYNVTAVQQSDPISGTGPGYLLNGLSDKGYWYQVGLSWNWAPGSTPGTGFDMLYEVFDPGGNSIFPTIGGGVLGFSGAVYPGDTVLLNLYFSTTYGVVMLAQDYNTGAHASETYSAEGATSFLGLRSSTTNLNGYFTGLMTEWYHSSPFYGNIAPVVYSNPGHALASSWMWINEFSCSDASCSSRTSLFVDATLAPVSYANPTQLQKFASHNATEYSNAYKLVTGPAYWAITASFAINGGGSGYSQPTFTYSYNGANTSVTLAQLPAAYEVDAGSSWSVSGTLFGSSRTERWAVISPQPTGEATSNKTINFVYQHQYRLFVAGGSGGSNGDGWYASGSAATATSLGVYERSAGSGQRLASYSVEGVSTQVTPTTGQVSVSVGMTSSHKVVFTSAPQFGVSLGIGAKEALNSITSPTIVGDQYWYDVGSQVSVTLNGVWGRTSGTGFRLISYSVDGGSTVQTKTSATVAVLSIDSISSPQSINATVTAQYELSTPTGVVVSVTPPALDGDTGWYDFGTAVTVTYDNAWEVVPHQSRIVATGYNSDGGNGTTLFEFGNGTFIVRLVVDRPHTVGVKSTTQYYTSFQFTDASGSKTITPTNLQILVDGQVQDVKDFSIWLNNGAVFTVSGLTYEGADVKSPSQTEYHVAGPAAITLRGLVYDATLKVTDFLGLPVSGAQISMTLANSTTIFGTTNSDGVYVAPDIPLGNFNARISALGSTAQVAGDASKQSLTSASLFFSDLSLGLVIGLIVIALFALVFLMRRRHGIRSP